MMAKWKWHESISPAGGSFTVNVVSYGWLCADCGVDLNKYLSGAGYASTVSMLYMKRNAPKLDFCPRCGAKKRDDGRA